MDDAEAVLVQSSYDSFRADGYFFRRISSTMSVISVNTL